MAFHKSKIIDSDDHKRTLAVPKSIGLWGAVYSWAVQLGSVHLFLQTYFEVGAPR